MIRLLLLFVVLLVVLHHAVKHKSDLAGLDRFFQLSDIDSHEVWVVALLAFILGTSF